ncbi:10 kDa chaperonin [Candidatus Tremblaya princeps]|uniref:10 kDa chaperonin n=1 Tax=Tremblaya princeps TaxID=189385 RepID=A0A143WNG5_TREPR|nr:10 kDa chaperonin [Candidatus Tremblaya princeps]
MNKIRPLGYRVVVNTKTPSGIVIPDTAAEKQDQGTPSAPVSVTAPVPRYPWMSGWAIGFCSASTPASRSRLTMRT